MVFTPAQTLTEFSQLENFAIGDLLLTGTPGGVALQPPKAFVQRIAGLLPESVKWDLFIKNQAGNPRYLKAGDQVVARSSTSAPNTTRCARRKPPDCHQRHRQRQPNHEGQQEMTRTNGPVYLAHWVVKTARAQQMIDWYGHVFGAHVVHEDDSIAFLTWDEESHRLALIKVPGPVKFAFPLAKLRRKV